MSELAGVLIFVVLVCSAALVLNNVYDAGREDGEYWHRRYCESQPYAPDQLAQCLEEDAP